MRAIIRPTELEDSILMAPHLRADDLREVEAAQGAGVSIEDVLHRSSVYSDDPRTVEVEGEPIAMFGIVSATDPDVKTGFVWLMGTEGIQDIGIQFLRGCKAQLAEIEKGYDVLTNCVDKRNTLHINWLKWMGFTFIGEVENYGAEKRPFYEFVRLVSNV